jgi:uncharacterized membrane protein
VSESSAGHDRGIELFLSRVLQVGVAIAGVVVLIGGIVYLSRHGTEMPQDRIFHGEPADLKWPLETLDAAEAGRSIALIQIGVFLLIGIPVARVALSVLAFGAERDWTYVIITLIVLAILTLSLLGYGLE